MSLQRWLTLRWIYQLFYTDKITAIYIVSTFLFLGSFFRYFMWVSMATRRGQEAARRSLLMEGVLNAARPTSLNF